MINEFVAGGEERRDMSYPARLSRYTSVSMALALLDDEELARLVSVAAPLGAGIGGSASTLAVAGTPVFVKRVALTELESRPEHVMSTANLFRLPTFCQYGIGSPGFGVWREVATHVMTTGWVLTGAHPGFPLLYHWRVVPGPASILPTELSDVDSVVEYWEGSPAVRARVEAIARSTASVLLFLEYIPQTLNQWLRATVTAGGDAADAALAMVESKLAAGTGFMNARGLIHFDAHFDNLLTDGTEIYFADFGLAASSHFELGADEIAFFERHLSYDSSYTTTYFVHWLVTAVLGCSKAERVAVVADCARGDLPSELVDSVAGTIIQRHAPVAVVANEFYEELQTQSRWTPYPAERIRALLDGPPSNRHQRS